MRGLLLLSGGIDSAVAGHLMQKKDLEVSAVHFSSEPFTDNSPEVKSLEISKKLGFRKLFVVNIGQELSELSTKCRHRYYFVLSKRLMFRTAEQIAKNHDYQYLITGESIGQVSSQTVENLAAIQKSVDIEVLRPLLCFDKNEIIKIARDIGTYEISKGKELCCVLGPKHPVTRARIENVLNEEKRVDVKSMVKKAVSQMQEINPNG